MRNSVLLYGGFVSFFGVFCFSFLSEGSFHGYADVQVCKGCLISSTVEEVC